MKILKLIAFALIVIGFNATAQNGKFNAGITAGPSLIYLRGNDFLNINHQANLGYSAGLSIDYKLSPLFSVASNLSYERKGSQLDLNFTDNQGNLLSEQTLFYNFDYLSLPILAKLSIGKNKFKTFINVGPYLGFLLKQKTKFSESTFQLVNSENTEAYTRLDFGISSGIGLLFPISEKVNFTFETRYNLGLKNINLMPLSNDYSIKTNSINALIGMTYNLGKPE